MITELITKKTEQVLIPAHVQESGCSTIYRLKPQISVFSKKPLPTRIYRKSTIQAAFDKIVSELKSEPSFQIVIDVQETFIKVSIESETTKRHDEYIRKEFYENQKNTGD